MDHHHHHHSHRHGHHDAAGLSQRNEEHFDNVAATIFKEAWIAELGQQIIAELRKRLDWIGLKTGDSGQKTEIRMLDYACGNGLASDAFAPYVSIIRGMDISSQMTYQYNIQGQEKGDSRHAIQGDLLPPTSSSPALNTPEYHSFNLIVLSMALHHVHDPPLLIERLGERLASGGILLIIDWVAAEESECGGMPMPKGDNPVRQTISRSGFTQGEMKGMFEGAGLGEARWKWFDERVKMPEAFGGEKQLFLARAERV